MDSVFGSPKINRSLLAPNRGVKAQFNYSAVEGRTLSPAKASVFSYASRGRGVQGESVNSSSPSDKLVIKRDWRPM